MNSIRIIIFPEDFTCIFTLSTFFQSYMSNVLILFRRKFNIRIRTDFKRIFFVTECRQIIPSYVPKIVWTPPPPLIILSRIAWFGFGLNQNYLKIKIFQNSRILSPFPFLKNLLFSINPATGQGFQWKQNQVSYLTKIVPSFNSDIE